jgi:hypothetical protein
MYVRIDYSDGQFSMSPASMSVGVYITPEMWARYDAFCADARFWHGVLSALDSLEYYKREERERKDV